MVARCVLIASAGLSVIAAPQTGRQDAGAIRRVVVHSHSIELFIAGEPGAGPTVVLEAGGGDSRRVWDKVIPLLARFTRVVSYDRPGIGGSQPCSDPETGRRVATELQTALLAAGINPPYLLVAHSLGGLFARVFASTFPTEVSALVLADPTLETFYARLHREQPQLYELLVNQPDSPKGVAKDALDAAMWQATLAEPLPEIPVIVVSRSDAERLGVIGEIWTAEQKRWVERVPNARFIVTKQSGHAIPQEEPSAIVDAVRELLHRP